VALAVFLVRTNSSLKLSTSQTLSPVACSINHHRQQVFLFNNSSRISLQLVDYSLIPQTLVQEVFLQISLLQGGCSMLPNNSSQVASSVSNNSNNNLLVGYLHQSLPLVVYLAILNQIPRPPDFSKRDNLKVADYSEISQPHNRLGIFSVPSKPTP
jgi:hypothetical protein